MTDIFLRESEILEEHQIGFEDDFIRALDSWFSSDIACCDSCYDSFVNYWPLADDVAFQSALIDIDALYSGSKRLMESYTQEEYDVLKYLISCPRCDSKVDANIWVYTLPFSCYIDIFEFECNIERMEEISKKTPFLLLKNDFALEIHDFLHDLAKNTKGVMIEHPLYRARISTQVDKLEYPQFSVAPKEYIQEGRYNHAGEQVLYLASDHDTCFNEIGSKLCYVAEFLINKPLKTLDLSNPDESHAEVSEKIGALVYSALVSKKLSTSGYDKPVYIFSRFVADCAKSAGFDAIKYPSTKSIGDNFNIVVINDEIINNEIEFQSLSLRDFNKIYPLNINT